MLNLHATYFFQMFSIAPTHGLASFGIHFLSLKGCKLVDESMSASIVLCDVQLDDIRPDRQKFITKFVFQSSVVIKKENHRYNAENAEFQFILQ